LNGTGWRLRRGMWRGLEMSEQMIRELLETYRLGPLEEASIGRQHTEDIERAVERLEGNKTGTLGTKMENAAIERRKAEVLARERIAGYGG